MRGAEAAPKWPYTWRESAERTAAERGARVGSAAIERSAPVSSTRGAFPRLKRLRAESTGASRGASG